MQILISMGNTKDVIAVWEVLAKKKITFDGIRQVSGGELLEIRCTGGFGTNGNSKESISDELSRILSVQRVSKIKVGYILASSCGPDQREDLYVRSK